MSGAEKDTKDVEMEEAKDSESKESPPEKDKDLLTFEDAREALKLVEKGVTHKEAWYISRGVRSIQTIRKRQNDAVLRRLIIAYFPAVSTAKDDILQFLEEPMDMEQDGEVRPRSSKPKSQTIPELEVYLYLLVLLLLLDHGKKEQAMKCSNLIMEKLIKENRRTLDQLAARCYYYHARVYQLNGQFSTVRSFFHLRLRTATLRHDEEGQAVLINLLLWNYLEHNLYDQADKLVSKSTFPQNANNNEWARHLFYLGRIRAIQLDYSESHRHLIQAIRKAPQSGAIGFKQTAHKFAVVVQLLLGEIPDKAMFRDPTLKKPLLPYFRLTQAVRSGDLVHFNEVLTLYRQKFIAEKTFTLIIRLRHNVIKTGIRMISLSYSRISLADIAAKLQLDSPQDAEYIIAKAIRDGVIEASLDHEEGYMQSKENIDIYSTKEPQEAFHHRITFCLDIHNQSVKAMRYPPKSYNKDMVSAEERREREQQDIELAKEMADEDEEDFP
ncbi:26S proteasome non-ATPase regulatory subunit 3-like [Dysidea avara]|uniref:26S proteasome non-ATPase regulatory subunit 3-like n=1 Tax=Dysidea avara TaxID=196820 RepID=UPI0033326CE4